MSRLRNGKIARLSHGVRELLNLRLFDGESATDILPWLNAIPAVQEILSRDFDGAEINAQNLSDWRNGGYCDWHFSEQRHTHIRAIVHEAEGFQEVAGGLELIDHAAVIVTSALLRLVHDLTIAVDGQDPGQQEAIFKATREIEKLQRHSLALRKLQFHRERWQAAQARAAQQSVRPGGHEQCPTPAPASSELAAPGPSAPSSTPPSAPLPDESSSIKPNQAITTAPEPHPASTTCQGGTSPSSSESTSHNGQNGSSHHAGHLPPRHKAPLLNPATVLTG